MSSGAAVECPICFRSYAEVDPTALPCGHSCCLEDGKLLWNCALCGAVVIPEKLTVNYSLRDVAILLKSLQQPPVSQPRVEVENHIIETNEVEESLNSVSIIDETLCDGMLEDVPTEESTSSDVKKSKKNKNRNKNKAKARKNKESLDSALRSNAEVGEDYFRMNDTKDESCRGRLMADIEQGNKLAAGLVTLYEINKHRVEIESRLDAFRSSMLWLLNEVTLEKCDKYCLYLLSMLLLFKDVSQIPVDDIDITQLEKSHIYMKQSADLGYGVAQFKYAHIFLSKSSLRHNECIHYYRMAINQQSQLAMMNLGSLLSIKSNKESQKESFRLMSMAADLGNSDALVEIGHFYHHGIGVAKNYKKAAHYFRLAVNAGNKKSFNILADAYEQGIGVSIDCEEAFKLYKQGADLGDNDAYFSVASYYEHGLWCEKNELLALKYYTACTTDESESTEKTRKIKSLVAKIGLKESIACLQQASEEGFDVNKELNQLIAYQENRLV